MDDAQPQASAPAPGDALLAQIPPELRLTRPLQLPPPLAESELNARLIDLASPNTHLDEAICFLGGGAWDHYVPAIVDALADGLRLCLVAPDSPQPLLQAVFELQTLFAALAGQEMAAPFADGPAALAEAIRAAARATGRTEAVVTRSTNPRYRAILRSCLAPLAVQEAGYHGGVTRPSDAERLLTERTACLVVEQPNYFGCFEDLPALATAARRCGALLVAKVDPIALGILAPPSADIVVADAQPLGSRPWCGSEALGLLACRAGLAPALGGWRVERTPDAFRLLGRLGRGLRADRLLRPLVYLATCGAEGIARAALLSMTMAHALQRSITAIESFALRFRAPFFKEFAVECHADPRDVAEALLESNLLGALPLQGDYPEMEHCALFAATERRTPAEIDLLRHALELMGDLGGESGFSLDSDDV
ncbi:MAG TPA: hypothetical protein PLE19_09620 [Planctomycetota bacterium]|nr:hypothetical protein [Planctomycetota bacterium]HRR82109.1 hypothetical protein [Planctomycetota bacterium]HRT97381.1 hypothetical protein [Planctomycetota bacterium]